MKTKEKIKKTIPMKVREIIFKMKSTKKRCKNCNSQTDAPAFVNAKIICQQCALYFKAFRKLPSKDYIKKLKSNGLWKH